MGGGRRRDYVRGTNMHYYGMQVWYSRLVEGDNLADWLDESSPLTLWNTFTKESVKVPTFRASNRNS